MKLSAPWHSAVVRIVSRADRIVRARQDRFPRLSELRLRENSITLGSHLWHVSGEDGVRSESCRAKASMPFDAFSTYLGEPIPYDPNVTPEMLAAQVSRSAANDAHVLRFVVFRSSVRSRSSSRSISAVQAASHAPSSIDSVTFPVKNSSTSKSE